jgi:hypothetical protein
MLTCLNPPAIPFAGFKSASSGTGPCELGSGESNVRSPVAGTQIKTPWRLATGVVSTTLTSGKRGSGRVHAHLNSQAGKKIGRMLTDKLARLETSPRRGPRPMKVRAGHIANIQTVVPKYLGSGAVMNQKLRKLRVEQPGRENRASFFSAASQKLRNPQARPGRQSRPEQAK